MKVPVVNTRIDDRIAMAKNQQTIVCDVSRDTLRFARFVPFGMPDSFSPRVLHTKGKPIAKDVDLKVLAQRTPGFTGAALANLINEAALIAARSNKLEIEISDMEHAFEKMAPGQKEKTCQNGDTQSLAVEYQAEDVQRHI